MAVLYLHIGRGKAGSSTIQAMAHFNRDALAERGLIYPSGRIGHAQADVALDVRQPDLSATSALDQLVQQLDATPDGRFLVSSEKFITTPARGVEFLRDRLRHHDVRVLVYVRPYDEWMVSVYAERTKTARNSLDFDAMCADSKHVAMWPYLERWVDAFGWQALRVRSLIPQDLDGGSLESDLFRALGIGEPLPMPRRNSSPSWCAIEVARWAVGLEGRVRSGLGGAMKRSVLGLIEFCQQATEAIGYDERVQYLTPEISGRYAELFDADVARLGAGLGRSFPRARPVTSPRPFLPSVERIPEPVLRSIEARLADRRAVRGVLNRDMISRLRRLLGHLQSGRATPAS